LITLPVSVLLTSFAAARLEPRVLVGHGSAPLRSLLSFVAGAVAAVVLALVSASMLAAAGFDLRGLLLGTYVQRNALVVGFVMAFAIIPIIYTIAEDALSSIPENLRAGSLALGATPWQTTMRIVIPTAMSGLFSAMMIGLGRAVGETMIVLMAAGNTPVLDWNVFNGFRTLSANIAVELPEAVRGGTHYRTLFLAALALFLMTFVLNTAAELVRLRFRHRASQL
jgi:phosphate transport system permease protein